ncbi:MAG: hypothetical protein SVW77_03385 [Candidatus Nanohaloarchaea archaeon]|nr:hypothetical protein [Candidatus Nanohaloarchaea archaeon]
MQRADVAVYREAVQGETGGRDVGDTVARAAEEYPNALFHHGQYERMEPRGDVPHGEEATALGIDLKRTPDGDWVVIELMPNNFGKMGYDDAYQWGSIYADTNRSHHRFPFTDYLWGVRDKENAHDVIDAYMADLVPVDDVGSADTERVVVKDPERDGGDLVSIHHRTEFTDPGEHPIPARFRDQRNVEEFVPSQDVRYQGDPYDACMRYAVNLDLDEEGLTVTDLGGYWRTAATPKDAESGLDARYLANLDRGNAVPATFRELGEAASITHDVVAELYEDFL